MKNPFNVKSLFKTSVKYLCKPMYCTLGHILIGGGTGFIGNNLRDILIKENYEVTVISRVKTGENHIISWEELIKNGIPRRISAVVNLTGEPIMVPFKYFGRDYMKRIWISRVGSTMLLTDIINNTECKPDTFITVTSTDIYPSNGIYTEDYLPTHKRINCNFFAQLALATEKATKNMETRVRHVSIRTGTVLGYGGGIMKWLYYPTLIGLGANIGNGCQYQPWIHLSDLLYLILFSIENQRINGVLNGVSPEIITISQLTTIYGHMLKRSVKLNIPPRILMAIYGTERSKLLLEGRQVVPMRTLKHGFKYEYREIYKAIEDIVKRN